MVQIAHAGGNEEKINEILIAAQNRFGRFGFNKTTMQEIAEDLGISKASLYYYFPDKEQLFRSVFTKEQQEFIENLHKAIDQSDVAEELIFEFLQLRISNFKMFINLGRASLEEFKGIKIIVKDLWEDFRKKEVEEIKRILEKGIQNNQFDIESSEDLAVLYLDIIRGLGHLYMKSHVLTSLTEQDYASVEEKLRRFTTIFIRGIRKIK